MKFSKIFVNSIAEFRMKNTSCHFVDRYISKFLLNSIEKSIRLWDIYTPNNTFYSRNNLNKYTAILCEEWKIEKFKNKYINLLKSIFFRFSNKTINIIINSYFLKLFVWKYLSRPQNWLSWYSTRLINLKKERMKDMFTLPLF